MSMRQLLDLGRENATLKRELAGIRAELEPLQRRLTVIRHVWVDRACASAESASPDERCVGARIEAILDEVFNPEEYKKVPILDRDIRTDIAPARDRGRVRPSCGRRKARRAPSNSRPHPANHRSVSAVQVAHPWQNFGTDSLLRRLRDSHSVVRQQATHVPGMAIQ